MCNPIDFDPDSYYIERPARSVLIVKMRSKPFQGRRVPDATFTFRLGEPQYELWEQRYYEQERAFANEENAFQREWNDQLDYDRRW